MMDYVVFAKKPGDKLARYDVESAPENPNGVTSHIEAIALVKAEHPDATVLAYLSTLAPRAPQGQAT